jgi:Flp pilus assembly protein TadG
VTERHRTGMHERGSTLAEFAIALTASLTLIVGVIDFGRGLYSNHLVSNLARLGTRYAIVRGTSCTNADCPATVNSIQTYVRGLAPELNQGQIDVQSNWTTGTGCAGAPYKSAGCNVSVQVTYPFTFAGVPLLPSFSMQMRSTSKMIISL